MAARTDAAVTPNFRSACAAMLVGDGEQAEQDVLGADVAVLKLAGLLLGADHDRAGLRGKALKHAIDGPSLLKTLSIQCQ